MLGEHASDQMSIGCIVEIDRKWSKFHTGRERAEDGDIPLSSGEIVVELRRLTDVKWGAYSSIPGSSSKNGFSV